MNMNFKKYSLMLFFAFTIPFSFAQHYDEINSKNVELLLLNNFSQAIQLGQSNQLMANLNAQNLNAEQLGNGNQITVLDSAYIPQNESIYTIQTIGNQNSITILGSNSISENMSLLQRGNQKSITVINR